MPFYFRKSISAGPFRFNFSKAGVGVSVGVKGLRLGTGPRGHYVHAGRGGVYYRASLGRAGEKRSSPSASLVQPEGSVHDFAPYAGVDMIDVESGDVDAMKSEVLGDLLNEINEKQRQLSAATALGWLFGLAGAGAIIAFGPAGVALLVLSLPAWAIGRWFDSFRRVTVLFYDLDPSVEQSYRSVITSFDALSSCAGKWHVEAGGAVKDLTTWKRNAGASHIVRKTATALTYRLPAVLRSNLTPPTISVGRQIIYFLPDVALVQDGKVFGAIDYADLRMVWQHSNFIEEGTVPADTEIIGRTWKYPNKKGGPDRRFANNYEIPICRYEVLHFRSDSGVNELVEFSRAGVCGPFAQSLGALSQRGAGKRLPSFAAHG